MSRQAAELLDKAMREFRAKEARNRKVTITMTWWQQATIAAALSGFRNMMARVRQTPQTEQHLKDIDEAIAVIEGG